jgi:hypothetical protein
MKSEQVSAHSQRGWHLFSSSIDTTPFQSTSISSLHNNITGSSHIRIVHIDDHVSDTLQVYRHMIIYMVVNFFIDGMVLFTAREVQNTKYALRSKEKRIHHSPL